MPHRGLVIRLVDHGFRGLTRAQVRQAHGADLVDGDRPDLKLRGVAHSQGPFMNKLTKGAADSRQIRA